MTLLGGMSCWNAGAVEAALEASPAVAACLAGHDHPGGYGKTLMRGRGADGRMWGRVHHVTLEAMLEAPQGSTSYAILEVESGPGRYCSQRHRIPSCCSRQF